MTPNARLWRARQEKRWNQTQLAAQVEGVTQADVSRMEKDGWVPPPAIQVALAQVLEAPVEDLFPPQSVAS